ncbi:MAG: hypothetical protein ABI621_16905 [Chloroflexota bacterium]
MTIPFNTRETVHERVGRGAWQENVLKASAIPVYDLSAMTAKRIASYWIRQASPFLSILPGITHRDIHKIILPASRRRFRRRSY